MCNRKAPLPHRGRGGTQPAGWVGEGLIESPVGQDRLEWQTAAGGSQPVLAGRPNDPARVAPPPQ